MTDLESQLAALGHALGRREAAHATERAAAREKAAALHAAIGRALDAFHQAAKAEGAEHLRVELSGPRTDDKHLHAVQIDLARGRHRAIVTVKGRGEITLVGPFRAGRAEGPCRTLPVDAGGELDRALADLLGRFLAEAATP